MKNLNYIIILLFITLFLSCESKTESKKNTSNLKTAIDKPECEVYYNKYIGKASKMENDSAMYFLNKSINCDPDNNNYKFSKARFFVDNQKYPEALKQLNDFKIDSIDPLLKLFSSVLKLKLNNSYADKDLNEVYIKIEKIEKPTSSNLFYKIALDNYFKGKEYSLIEGNRFKEQYKGKQYENQNIIFLENLIKNETKETVLFKIFNIR